MKWKQDIYPDKNTKQNKTNSANNTLTYFYCMYQNIATSGVIGYLPLPHPIFCTLLCLAGFLKDLKIRDKEDFANRCKL